MSGPVLGGQLVDTLGWPWIFYTNVPIALVLLVLGRAGLPDRGQLHLPPRSWLLEAGVLGTAAVTVLLATSLAVTGAWLWAGLALAAPPLVVIWRRMEVARPIVALVSAPGMGAVHVSLVATYTVLLAVQFLTPFFLTRTLETSAAVTGLTLLALPATTAALGVIAGVLADRFDHRRVALTGAVIIAAAIALLAPLSDLWAPIGLAWRLALLGSGLGLFMTPTSSLAMTIAPHHLLGVHRLLH